MNSRKICLFLFIAAFACHVSIASILPVKIPYTLIDSLPVKQIKTDTSYPQYYRLNGEYLKSYWTSFKQVVTSPGRWKGRDWRNFGIIVGGTAALSIADIEIRNFMQRNLSTFSTSVSDIFEPFGNHYPPLILTSLYLTSILIKDRKLEHATLVTVKSFATSTFFYIITKAAVRRQRPSRATDQYEFATPFSNNNYTSFPSGHANTVFSIATAMAIEYKHTKWVPILSYSLATLISLSRVHENRHWVSDIIIGASIGHFVTKAIYGKERKKKLKPTP